MELATWNYYQNTYYGDVITTESLFDKYEAKAVDKLQQLCFDRITDDVKTEYTEKLAKATCTLADTIYKIDQAEKNATDPQRGNIKQMSSGSESVSFGDNDTVITKALSDKTAQNRLYRDIAVEYLANTGLLYGGV